MVGETLYDGKGVSKGYANGVLGGSRDPYSGWSCSMRPPFSAACAVRPAWGTGHKTRPAMRREDWHGNGGVIARDFIEDPSPARIFRKCPPASVMTLPFFDGATGQYQWPTKLPTPQSKIPPPAFVARPHGDRDMPRRRERLEHSKNWTKDYAVGSLNKRSKSRGEQRIRGGQNYGQNVQTGKGFDGR